MDANNLRSDIAACGLYCGACRAYAKGKCPGCGQNIKATWCTVRSCCHEHGWTTCAECTLIRLDECRKFNNFISKCFKFIFRSDRQGCIERIREVGVDAFVAEMQVAGAYNRPVKKD